MTEGGAVSELDESSDRRVGRGRIVPFRHTDAPGPAPRSAKVPATAFSRAELHAILDVYGRMVAEGEWRDYAIDHLTGKAVFSVFRRSSEGPLYRIEKDPGAAPRRGGVYAVVAHTGAILRRGPDLSRVLSVLGPRPRLVVG
jgi:hypothetical protein